MSYTPGPWEVRWDYTRDRGIICVEHPAYDALDVVLPYWAKTAKEHKANARLVAAAPELLNACLLAADCIDKFKGKLSPGAKDRLLAAIAKAEGR